MNELFPPSAIVLVVIWPLLLAAAMLARSMHSVALRFAPWAALPAFLLGVFPPQNGTFQLSWVLLGTELGLESNTSRLFLLFTTLLWWLSGMYAQRYLLDRPGRNRFFGYFLLSMTGNLGLILAQDMMSFYLFFALMSFASYGLVVHERTNEALHAGRIYIILVIIGEIALFSAMMLAAVSTGSKEFATVRHELAQVEHRDLIMLLAFLGFGIKAGVLGLHVWLPLAHPVAPTPASAVLSGAMIKAGLLGWLRLLPLGETVMLQWGQVFMILGLATAFYGVCIGLTQRVPKTVLAYSSISQMGIMTMAVGLGLTAPEAYPDILTAITLYALHHGLNKGALFLGVGVIGACSGAQRRWVWLAMWLPALALAGAPLTSGMLAKVLLKMQIVNAPESWIFVLKILLPLSALATSLLVGRFLVVLFKPREDATSQLPAGLVWPWALLLAAAVILPWMLMPKLSTLWSLATFLTSFWPVLLGALLVVTARVWSASRVRQYGVERMAEGQIPGGYLLSRIPPGDILIPLSFIVKRILALGYRLVGELLPQWRDAQLAFLERLWSQLKFWRMLARFEATINQWSVAVGILLLLGCAMVMIGIFN